MSALLEKAYTGAAYLAAAFMVSILFFILAGILGRLLQFSTPGVDAYAGYSMAASAFLALAHTLRRGEHIRVTLILQHLSRRGRLLLEVASHLIGVALSGALAWFSVRLVWQSYLFNDVSQGLDATPLWIPQIGMALGALLLLVAFLHGCVEVYLHRRASVQPVPVPVPGPVPRGWNETG